MWSTIPLSPVNAAMPYVLEENDQEKEKASHRLGENICKTHF